MKQISNRIFSFAAMLAITFSTFSFALADEGMYAPDQIAKLPLKQRGLNISTTDIYNPNGVGLTDAVIRLSIGCTGEFVSPEGLILTNHHCGFDALVKASTPQSDLVETGFRTDNRSGEIPAKGYSIFITNRAEDVTAKVRAGTEDLTGNALAAAIKKNTDALQAAEQAKAPAGSTVRIQSLNSGFFHYLYVTTQIKDIRVVYAPPRNIGVFGGDPDNFQWTRHTGDFTFLRAYTAPDGSAAEFTPNNVPYKPKKHLSMNIGGLKENDFIFVLGYPGGTTRYRESWSIDYARDANFPFLERWLRALADTLRQIGSTDEEKRLAFQSEIANFDNSRTVYGGGALRLRRANVVQQQQEEEARLAKWIGQDPGRQRRYGTLLTELKAASEESNAAMKRDVIIRRFPDPYSMPVLGQMVAAATAVRQGKKLTAEDRSKVLSQVKSAFAEREPMYEKEMIKFFFNEFDALPQAQRFEGFDKLIAGKTGQTKRAAESDFAEKVASGPFTTPEKVLALYDLSWTDFQSQHPFISALVDERTALATRTAKFNSTIDRLRLSYVEALISMNEVAAPYPDANSTLRFSYGNIKGYAPREAEIRFPFTTLKGMLEKDTGVNPFDAPQKLRDLQNAKDFGRYGEGDSVVLNFLSTADIIGGNSGSPVLNGNGEQVGLVFDGNYEGLGNDFYYDPDYNRTISVDIRFVLFVTEKFGNAKWIVDEMTVTGRKERAAAGSID
jgi:hypothetical protein